MIEIQIAAAKVNKYAVRESGDTLELVERPNAPGGFTVILADGQGSGRAAKTLSNLVTSQCVTLIKGGARDGVVARAASDYLFAYRHGQVSATLNLLTADFTTQTFVITRNNPHPVYIVRPINLPAPEAVEQDAVPPVALPGTLIKELKGAIGQSELISLDQPATPIGLYARTRPVVVEEPMIEGLWLIAFTDGLADAGQRYAEKISLPEVISNLMAKPDLTAQACADSLLETALQLDRGRPADDMSVAVVATKPLAAEDGNPVPRRLNISVPFTLSPTI